MNIHLREIRALPRHFGPELRAELRQPFLQPGIETGKVEIRHLAGGSSVDPGGFLPPCKQVVRGLLFGSKGTLGGIGNQEDGG